MAAPVVAPSAVPAAAAPLSVVAVFPAGTLQALRSGLRTLAAVRPEDLSVADLQKLVITLNGVVVPSGDITFETPTFDAQQQIVIRFTVAGRTVTAADTLKIATPSNKLVLWGTVSSGGLSADCNVKTTAERLIRDQMLVLGRQAGNINAEAIERIAARLVSAMASSTAGDPTTTPELTYAVDVVARHLIGGEPFASMGSLDRPSAGGGGGGGGAPAAAAVAAVLAGSVTTQAGNGQGDTDGTSWTGAVAGTALFRSPRGIVVDPAGTNLYVADRLSSRIRKIVIATGAVTTVAGNAAGSVDGTGWSGAVAGTATFGSPRGITVDPAGTNLYVCDGNNRRIRKIVIATGAVTTLTGNDVGAPAGLADGTGWTGAVAGTATFDTPEGITVDPAGNSLYVTDTGNHRIRKIVIATGAVTTLAGNGLGNADGTGWTGAVPGTATFNAPAGITVDPAGTNLFVADSGNHRIRKIVIATGSVTTLAGNGLGSIDGTGWTGAVPGTGLFHVPYALALDPAGTKLYVCDEGNRRIRKVQ